VTASAWPSSFPASAPSCCSTYDSSGEQNKVSGESMLVVSL
jgi:hypothetical protein